ncbi:hypothetical protein [Limnothrix sp. PR1529]|nr:hypothetical protein [Limnothrix sp. PR1529]
MAVAEDSIGRPISERSRPMGDRNAQSQWTITQGDRSNAQSVRLASLV